MNSNYVITTSIPDEQHVSVNIYLSIRVQVIRPGHMLPDNMCPGVNAALGLYLNEVEVEVCI